MKYVTNWGGNKSKSGPTMAQVLFVCLWSDFATLVLRHFNKTASSRRYLQRQNDDSYAVAPVQTLGHALCTLISAGLKPPLSIRTSLLSQPTGKWGAGALWEIPEVGHDFTIKCSWPSRQVCQTRSHKNVGSRIPDESGQTRRRERPDGNVVKTRNQDDVKILWLFKS